MTILACIKHDLPVEMQQHSNLMPIRTESFGTLSHKCLLVTSHAQEAVYG